MLKWNRKTHHLLTIDSVMYTLYFFLCIYDTNSIYRIVTASIRNKTRKKECVWRALEAMLWR